MQMKVLLINDFEYEGGAEKVFRDTKEILKEQFEIRSYVGSKRHKLKKNPLQYLYSTPHKKQIRNVLDDFQPEIIHIHAFSHILSPSIFQSIRKYKQAANKNVKVVYTAHDHQLICPSSGYFQYKKKKLYPLLTKVPHWLQMFRMRLDNRSFLHSWLKKMQWLIGNKIVRIGQVIDLIITPSYYMKEMIEQGFEGEIRMIRNPIELNIRSTKTVNKGPARMAFIGRLSHEKGLVGFLNHLADIEEQGYKLDIIGEGTEKSAIEQVIYERSLSNRVTMLGSIEHSILMKKLSDCYEVIVLPSICYENAPLSLVEAANAGLSIFASNLGGIKEISDICGDNFLFDPNSMTSIKEQLHLCLNHLKTGQPKLNVITDFSSEYYKKQISQAYLSVLRE
jgi:glycosyltransferase involved in cell wall biosynthesis